MVFNVVLTKEEKEREGKNERGGRRDEGDKGGGREGEN